MVRGGAERSAPIQGSAADIIKIAMINIHKTISENWKVKCCYRFMMKLVFDSQQNWNK
jgi:DNA polymerase-1